MFRKIFKTEYPAVLLDDIQFFASEAGVPPHAEVQVTSSEGKGVVSFEWVEFE